MTEGRGTMVWVGVAASAGGLEALQAWAGALQPRQDATYIVAQHLSPKHDSMMVQLVQRSTSLRVELVQDGIEAEAGVIYITPPNFDVVVESGVLRLLPPRLGHVPKPSADGLFASIAEMAGTRAVAIVLSGTGADGARGVRSVHAGGGICIAQAPQSAKYDGMPQAAIDTGCIDQILPPAEIAEFLARLSAALPRELPTFDERQAQLLAELLDVVASRSRVDMRDYKKATVGRRVERRMVARSIGSLEEYLAVVRAEPAEADALFQDILISVTEFYRDPKAFNALIPVVERIVAAHEPGQPIRVWNVGCATGEEVYTVAMVFAEALGSAEALAQRNVQIFATDIDNRALAKARRGSYTAAALETLPDAWREKYFHASGAGYTIVKELRDCILFSRHNVIADPPFMRVDLICCRNLLIYFEPDLQKKIYSTFHYALQSDGYLFLGKSESTLLTAELFKPENAPAKIFQRRHSAFDRSQLHRVSRAIKPRFLAEPHTSAARGEDTGFFEALASRLGDGAVLVTEALDVEWLYGDVSAFTKLRQGAARMNLADLVNDVHRDELRALVYKAARERQRAQGQPKNSRWQGQPIRTQLTVYPIDVDSAGAGRLLAVFNKHDVKSASDPADDVRADSRIRELEEELAAAREHLQTVIEELETSNEELQSVNEELQSANEELQSTNEELETANEELQSSNEELVTVNDELNSKTSQLESMAEHLLHVKNSLDFPLMVVSRRGVIESANDAARRRFHIDAKTQLELKHVIPAHLNFDAIATADENVRRSAVQEELFIDSQDESYWLRIVPLEGEFEHSQSTLHVYLDITRQRRAEQQLAAARSEAVSANEAKSAFLASVSHDIRTPLTSISGGVFLLEQMGGLNEKQERVVGMMARSSNELSQLAEDFLNFTRIESGRIELLLAAISLPELLQKVVGTTRDRAEASGIEFECSISPALPPRVIADEVKLRQILLNLLGNALKFTAQGKVGLKVNCAASELGYATLRIEVTDTGVGIPSDRLEAIFESYTQASSGVTRMFGGTGLGLAIAKMFAEMMGGSISVDSRLGEGSTFVVLLPLKVAVSAQADVDHAESNVDPLFVTRNEAAACPILIVDDNPDALTVLSSYLDYLGCSYTAAVGGRNGLDAFKSGAPCIVISDLSMPDVDGFQLQASIREVCARTGAPLPRFIACSAHAHDAAVRQAALAGFEHILLKPINLRELRLAVANAQLAPIEVMS